MDWRVRSVAQLLFLGFLLALIEDGTAEQRVVCYYTNWSVYRPGTAKFSPQNINPYLCTHLIYAFGGFTKENTLKPFDKYQDIEKGGYAKFTGLKTYNKNLKTMLAVGGWNEGSSRFSPMVADPERRKQFVRNTIKFLRQNHFDGLDLDWEYPAFRDGGKSRDKDNYASLVQELREAYDRESSKTGRPRLLLTMAVPAGIDYINKGYDIPKLNKYLDFINLLSYDYHSSYEPAVNHHSPLYPLEEDNEYNFDTELTVDYTIKHLLDSGASPDKIVLGIPTYGRSYTLFNEDATEIGSPADGPGEEGDATREKGYLAYYEICESLIQSDEWEIVSPNPSAMGPYAYKGNQWVGYDDEAIVRLKAQYVTEQGLGGIMFWSIDNDDFRGKCHDRPYPLIEAAKEAMLSGSEKTSVRDKPTKTGTQSNFIGRKQGGGRRRTTEAPVVTRKETSRKRVNSLRSKSRSNVRESSEEDETPVQVNGRSRGQFIDTEEDEDALSDSKIGSNSVRSAAYSEDEDREDTSSRSQSRNRPGNAQARRRKPENNRRRGTTASSVPEPSAGSNRITTPAPPTTPDPGTDFKCEDEGFFSHPRDCKKYFWCLDAGPGGLGIVAHHFTCPSGLVFNKAADSCDYPRNVVCPKVKTGEPATTRAPIVAATSRNTRIQTTTRRPASSTTPESLESNEEYEYYDDEEEEDDVPVTTTTARSLQYKTLNRARPTTSTKSSTPTTTTTTTQLPETTTSRLYQAAPSRSSTIDAITSLEESEEDPRVIKELIELIKKAGGIEELEKQLHLQGKSGETGEQSSSATSPTNPTPATISRSLYERVLNRQAANGGNPLFRRTTSAPTTAATEVTERSSVTQRSRPSFRNGPGQAQFEGLDDIPEVKSIRRERPQYVTINRQRTSTQPPDENGDGVLEDNTDGASSDEKLLVSPPERTPGTQRETPGYVEIRRSRTSTIRSNVLDDEDESDEQNERRRPAASETEDEDEADDNESKVSQASTEAVVVRRRNQFPVQERISSTTSRYTSIQRVRSTTQASEEPSLEEDEKMIENVSESGDSPAEISTSTISHEKIDERIPESQTTETNEQSSMIEQSVIQTTASFIQSSTTESPDLTSTEMPSQNVDPSTSLSPITDKTIDESPATDASIIVSSSSTEESNSEEPVTKGSTTVSQPRPFSFHRRTRPTTTTTTITSPSLETTTTVSSSVSSNTGRVKVPSETVRLPTLKELIGQNTIVAHDHTSTLPPITLSIKNLPDESAVNILEKDQLLPELVDEERITNNIETPGINEDKSSSSTESSRPATLPIRILKQDKIPSGRRKIKLVKIPVRILESDRPLTDVVLEVPEHKLNSILESLLRVEILNENHTRNANSEESKDTISQEKSEDDLYQSSNELLRKDANAKIIVSENHFIHITSTEPSISTIRGEGLITPRVSRNRGFYVTKSIESSTNAYDNTAPTTKVPEDFDNELSQDFNAITEQSPTLDGLTSTESHNQFVTITEQYDVENPSTIIEESATATIDHSDPSERTWPSMISTSLENLNNILADNEDIDSMQLVTQKTIGDEGNTGSTEYSSSTIDDGETTTESDLTESSIIDDDKTVTEHHFAGFGNTDSEVISQPDFNDEISTSTSKSITEDSYYHAITSTPIPDIQGTTIDEKTEDYIEEITTSGYKLSSTIPELEINTISGDYYTTINTVAPEIDTKQNENENELYSSTESITVGTSSPSDFEEQTTTISSIDSEINSPNFTTPSSLLITASVPFDSITKIPDGKGTDFITTTEIGTTSDMAEESTTAISLDSGIESTMEILNKDSRFSTELKVDAEEIGGGSTAAKNEELVDRNRGYLIQGSRNFIPTESAESGLTSRGFYRSPTAIPGRRTVRRRIIKKRIYGVRRPNVETIVVNDTVGDDFAMLNKDGNLNSNSKTKMKKPSTGRGRFVRRRIINHSTGEIVDEILNRNTTVYENRTITRDSNPELFENNNNSEEKSTLGIKELLKNRATYRRNRLNNSANNQTNISIDANIFSSQNNNSASINNDVQSTSVSSTNPNQRRRIIVRKRYRYRDTGNLNSFNLSPVSPSSSSSSTPSPETMTVTEKSLDAEFNPTEITTLDYNDNNNNYLQALDKHETTVGQHYTDDVTIDNLSSGSESHETFAAYEKEEEMLIPKIESISEALDRSEDMPAEGEINLFKARPTNARKPGTLVRPNRPSTSTSVTEDEIVTTVSPSTRLPDNIVARRRFRLGQRPTTPSQNAVTEEQNQSEPGDGETLKNVKKDDGPDNFDESSNAQEVEVTVADVGRSSSTLPPPVSSGRPPFRTAIRRRIITTEATTEKRVSSTTRPTTIVRQRQRPARPFEKVSENQEAARPRRPAVIDYDYYDEDTGGGSIVGKAKLYGKISYSENGSIRCLDQGNFPHPSSCKKFITCARMVNGQLIGTEYTCPKRLSFDPIGGICNWSAGLGCKD